MEAYLPKISPPLRQYCFGTIRVTTLSDLSILVAFYRMSNTKEQTFRALFKDPRISTNFLSVGPKAPWLHTKRRKTEKSFQSHIRCSLHHSNYRKDAVVTSLVLGHQMRPYFKAYYKALYNNVESGVAFRGNPHDFLIFLRHCQKSMPVLVSRQNVALSRHVT